LPVEHYRKVVEVGAYLRCQQLAAMRWGTGTGAGMGALLLGAVALLLLVAARADGDAGGRRLLEEVEASKPDYCVTAEFPLQFKHPVDFNVNEGIGFLRDDSTNLECHCEDHSCGCAGEGEDCDEYSQIWFYVLAYAHQLGVFLYDFPKYSEQYHLGSMIVWG